MKLKTAVVNIQRFIVHPYLTLFSRIALGGVFILAGVAKITHISTLVWEIKQYHILNDALANAYGQALPPVEIVVGAFLVLGVWSRITAGLSGLLCLSFIIAKIIVYAWGLDIAICSCFGPAVPLLLTRTLAVDFVMLALVFQIIFHRGELLSLDALFLRRTKAKSA